MPFLDVGCLQAKNNWLMIRLPILRLQYTKIYEVVKVINAKNLNFDKQYCSICFKQYNLKYIWCFFLHCLKNRCQISVSFFSAHYFTLYFPRCQNVYQLACYNSPHDWLTLSKTQSAYGNICGKCTEILTCPPTLMLQSLSSNMIAKAEEEYQMFTLEINKWKWF